MEGFWCEEVENVRKQTLLVLLLVVAAKLDELCEVTCGGRAESSFWTAASTHLR